MAFKRSRAIWDDTKRPEYSWLERYRSYGRAILYELQPIRFKQVDWYRCWIFLHDCGRGTWYILSTAIPLLLRCLYDWAAQSSWMHRAMILVVVGYYYFLKWIHETLSAGPFVLMITVLIGIFTIGLGDTADGNLSAYSVFNRGFERILGSMDADALLAQHIGAGGGLVMGALGAVAGRGVEGRGENQQDEAPVRIHPARRGVGREPQGHPPPHENGDVDPNANEGNAIGDNPDIAENPGNNPGAAAHPGGGSRKSGKKARRRNLELRREIRRQREAAVAMGFGDGEDEIAMQRLLDH